MHRFRVLACLLVMLAMLVAGGWAAMFPRLGSDEPYLIPTTRGIWRTPPNPFQVLRGYNTDYVVQERLKIWTPYRTNISWPVQVTTPVSDPECMEEEVPPPGR